MGRDYDNGGLQNSTAHYTVPKHWVEATNTEIDSLRRKVIRLEIRLAALAAHLCVEFRDIPAQPAKVTVVNVVAAY